MFKLITLPYTFDALEPFIDTHTLGLHYHKHLQNYLNNLNKIINEYPYLNNISLIDLAYNVDTIPNNIKDNLRFNLGGVINHNLYFNNISPIKQEPTGKLLSKINETFGSYDNFMQLFKKTALNLKGSGYTFLVINNDNKLQIINLPNQETPYYYHLTPLITLDMWEHAFYINYENKKDLYIDNFFNIINFNEANKYFNQN